MGKKQIIIDIMNETGVITVETVGYSGPKCKEESEFLKKALGSVQEETLTTAFYSTETTKEEHLVMEGRCFKPFCG